MSANSARFIINPANMNNNANHVKMRPKGLRRQTSSLEERHRHSLHIIPHGNNSSFYAEPYGKIYSHVPPPPGPPGPGPGPRTRNSGYYFNHFDGFIYVDPKARDNVRRNMSMGKRPQHRRAMLPPPFMGMPPLQTSSPPPSMPLINPQAPYYVSDTLHQHKHHPQSGLESSRSLSSPPSSDPADSSLDLSYNSCDSHKTRNESRSPERRNRAIQAEHRFDIRDYALLHGQDTPSQAAAAADHHQCCQCECHTAQNCSDADEEGVQDGGEGRGRRSRSADAATSGAAHVINSPGQVDHDDDDYNVVGWKKKKASRQSRSESQSVRVPLALQNHHHQQQRQLLGSRTGQRGSLHKSESLREPRINRFVVASDLDFHRASDDHQCDYESKYYNVNRVGRVGRSPTRAHNSRSTNMVLDQQHHKNQWSGISGVPGLGISIPHSQPRPKSACEFDQASKSAPISKLEALAQKSRKLKLRRSKKSSVKDGSDSTSTKSSISCNSNNSETGNMPASWSPNSLHSLTQLKLDLPRISASPSGAAQHHHRHQSPISAQTSSSSHRSSVRSSRAGSLDNGNTNSNQHGALARLHKLSSNSSPGKASPSPSVSQSCRRPHPVLSKANTVAQVQFSDPNSSMPWEDSVINRPMKRSVHRQSYHWDASKASDAPPTPPGVSKKDFDKRFPHLAAILRADQQALSTGPHSLPSRLLNNESSIPRAPIPTPEDDVSSGHYEKIKSQKSHHHQEQPRPRPRLFPEFSRKSLLRHVENSSGGENSFGSSSRDTTFDDSTEMSSMLLRGVEPGSQLYKVLNDKDGDYAYAYDCNLSPAFIIKYNEEHPVTSSSSDDDEGENIYEEISEVKKRGQESGSDEKLNSSSASSMNADSGVHVTSRKFSSDTLDFGPKSLRHRSRFSNTSSDSFDNSEEDEMSKDHGRKVKRSASKAIEKKQVNDKEFCEIIRRHHNRVLEQLKLDPEDFGPADKDPTVVEQDDEGQDESQAERRRSLSKFRALKFAGFSTRRGKSVGNLKPVSENNNESKKMSRCESLDMTPSEPEQQQQQQQQQQSGGWLRKYSEVFNKKYLSRKSSTTNTTASDSGNSSAASVDDEGFTDSSQHHHHHHQQQPRFQRSRITSHWENLHSLPE